MSSAAIYDGLLNSYVGPLSQTRIVSTVIMLLRNFFIRSLGQSKVAAVDARTIAFLCYLLSDVERQQIYPNILLRCVNF